MIVVDSLSGLVDVGIDSNRRVIEDEKRDRYFVVLDEWVDVYPPQGNRSEASIDASTDLPPKPWVRMKRLRHLPTTSKPPDSNQRGIRSSDAPQSRDPTPPRSHVDIEYVLIGLRYRSSGSKDGSPVDTER